MKFNAANDTLSSHLLKFDKLIRELRSTGAKLEETDIVCHLLLTMPAEYDTIVTAIETLSMKQLTVSFVKNRLLHEESKRKDVQKRSSKSEVQSSTAFSSQAGNSSTNKYKNKSVQDKSQQRFPFACNNCGIKGHKAADCRRKPQRNRNNNNTKTANVDDGLDRRRWTQPKMKKSQVFVSRPSSKTGLNIKLTGFWIREHPSISQVAVTFH